MANFDELRRQMEQDELKDQIDATLAGETKGEQTKMTVIDYARAKGMAPQRVYYYIRTGRIKQEKCICGRWVLDIRSAEEFFAPKEEDK